GINLQTDNYFQYTSNASAFEVKRKYILLQTHLRFNQNVLAFSLKRKGVFFTPSTSPSEPHSSSFYF
ncbi:hypothetical protein, partial [Phocaeicola plebeius]|uniref:hypothetical protein n=2 Tax=Phocaeicola plebeius TaxID=310297 RepID=UPI001C6FD756